MNSLQGLIASFILSGFAAFVRILPLRAALFLGRRMGDVAFMLAPRQRGYALAHLKIAFAKTMSYAQIKTVLRQFYHSYGQSIVEIARLPLVARHGYENLVELVGRAHLDEAMKKGRGCILLSIHSGNWELSNLVGSMSGHPYNMVANDLNHVNKVAAFLNDLRRSAGCRIIHPGIGGREIIRRLQQNEIVTLVADQGGADGLKVPFFGRMASMSTGGIRIALKYGAAVMLVNMHRLSQGRHRLEIVPFELTRTQDIDQDVTDNLHRMMIQYESWVRANPKEYVWPYKTWKYAKDRTVLVLDDGRVGHLRQSQALARTYAVLAGKKGYEVAVKVVPVRFRPGFMMHVWPRLEPASLDALRRIHPDVVISCGARNTAINRWISRDARAKSIAILPSRIFPSRMFNLVVMPRHDVIGKHLADNVITTQVAPNLIDKAYLDSNVQALLLRYPHLKDRRRLKMAVLIGGNAKGVSMSTDAMKVVFRQLRLAAENLDCDCLITTSRRTPADVEDLAVQDFKDCQRTALLIIVSRENIPEAVGGLLGLADVVVVSGESVSMISESVSSGKDTVVFPVGTRKDTKYMRFCKGLAADRHIAYASTEDLAVFVENVVQKKIKIKPVDDNAILMDALEKVV